MVRPRGAGAGNLSLHRELAAGLVEGVRAVVVSSRGGIHRGETTDAVTPYLRAVLGLMGIREVEFIYAEGLDNRPHGRDAGIASARAQIARLAVPA